MTTQHSTPSQPVCTVLEAATNLGKLGEARNDLTVDEASDLANYILGHVSSYVPPTVWDKAITEACLFIARQRAGRQAVAS